jgi:hypothetical protein
MQTQEEIFKNVPGYEGLYQVSNIGRVKSLERIVIKSNGFKMFVKEKILKQSFQRGYSQHIFSKDGKISNFKTQIGYFLHEEDAYNAYEYYKNNFKRERDE